MNYNETLNYIDNINNLGSKLDLSRIREILSRLGNPQNSYRVIHVAGTNGKGSVSSMLANILISAGYKTAQYTSPHLENYNERFMINNKEISNSDFSYFMTIIRENSDSMTREGFGTPTVFEQLTAMAFLYFQKQNVEYAVIEVGLGGRFDATNVVDKPLLSVIASISFDHTEFLGNTLESIAFEKGGIIKNNCPTVLYNQSECVYNVINKLCEERHSKLYVDPDEKIDVIKQDIEGTLLSLKNKYIELKNVSLPLIGEYQLKNCALAILSAQVLRECGVELSEENIRTGILNTRWNGRMEVCKRNPVIVLDGAHNPDGILMLAKSAEKYFSDKRIVLLMGVLSDKEYEKMAEEIIPLASAVVITRPDSERALSADGFKQVALKYCDEVYSLENIEEAYRFALSLTNSEDVLLCSGSLYLIGRLRTLIMGGSKNVQL